MPEHSILARSPNLPRRVARWGTFVSCAALAAALLIPLPVSARPIVVEALGLRTIDPQTGKMIKRLTRSDSRQPLWAPDGRKIIFARGHENDLEIFSIGRNGRGLKRLTNNDRLDEWPSWAPGSRRIVVERYDVSDASFDNELFVVRADGSGGRNLTANEVEDNCPDWSPKGGRIAFSRGPQVDIYSIRPDGSNEKRLTSGPRVDYGPKWSPDGKKILFRTFVDARGGPAAEQEDLAVIDRDGSHRRRLTDTRVGESVYGWSPDGRRIAFVASRGEENSLWVMRADGKHRRRLVADISSSESGIRPSWSRDGRKIAYGRVIEQRDGSHSRDVWVVSVDGSRNRRLTRTDFAQEFGPAWHSSPQECAGTY